MATQIPGFATQVLATAETVQVTTGSIQALATTRYYYFVSNRATAGNGQSLLRAIEDLLEASLPGTFWTVILAQVGKLYKIRLSHSASSAKTVTFSPSFATALGFASYTFTVPVATIVYADYPSYWWWSPEMPISLTGPDLFDPTLNYGVPESAGASQRAPDSTTAYVQNQVQFSAEYTFNGVQFYYKIRPQVGHTNEDLETWWAHGPASGRRVLMWRDSYHVLGGVAPPKGSASPWYYVEYAPQETLRGALPAHATAPPNLVYWDVKLDFWATENGETPLAD